MSEDEDDWFERATGESDDAEGPRDGDREPAAGEADEEDWFEAASGAEGTGLDIGGVEIEDPDEDRLFETDFAAAFESAPFPGGDDIAGEGPASGFEEEAFESTIPRIDVGIDGLDEMIEGGIPRRSLMVAIGGAGTGKTTFGLQFVNEALESGDSAVFIALEETQERIVDTAEDKGWEFGDHVDEGRLAVVDLDPIEMANSLSSIRNELPGLVRDFGASRLVLDSVSLLEMMYDDQPTRRNEVFDFTNSLKQAGVTTFLTSEASGGDPYRSRFGIIEYLTDAVFVLRYIRPQDYRETRLAVEIQKIRDANHSRQLKPYEITSEGISVYRQANIF